VARLAIRSLRFWVGTLRLGVPILVRNAFSIPNATMLSDQWDGSYGIFQDWYLAHDFAGSSEGKCYNKMKN